MPFGRREIPHLAQFPVLRDLTDTCGRRRRGRPPRIWAPSSWLVRSAAFAAAPMAVELFILRALPPSQAAAPWGTSTPVAAGAGVPRRQRRGKGYWAERRRVEEEERKMDVV